MFRKGLLPLVLICAFALTAASAHATTTTTGDSGSTPCAPVDLNQGTVDNPSCASVPHFKASFSNRVWKFKGSVNEVNGYRHLLNFTLESMPGLPQRFASQDDEILDQDLIARYRRSTRIYGPDGRITDPEDLYYAANVVVSGRLLSQSTWLKGEDGALIPTIRARRITILDYADSGDGIENGDDSGNTQPQQPSEGSDDGSAEVQPVPTPEPNEEYDQPWFRYKKHPHYQKPQYQQPDKPQGPAPQPVSQPAAGQGPMVCENTTHSEVSEDGSISTWVEVKCHRR